MYRHDVNEKNCKGFAAIFLTWVRLRFTKLDYENLVFEDIELEITLITCIDWISLRYLGNIFGSPSCTNVLHIVMSN